MSDQVVLKADKEHGGLQFTVPLIMLAAGTAGFMSIDSLVLAPLLGGGAWDGFRPVLRIVFSIALGVAVGGLAEMAFKRWWESGKALRLDARGVTIERKEERPERIEWSKQLPVLRWKYGLHSYQRGGRERRVPASHLLFSCRLLQDDCSVIVYGYLSPKQAREVPDQARFVEINVAELHRSGLGGRLSRPARPRISVAMLSGQHGQIWAAEKERWAIGFELEPSDFISFVDAIPPQI
ncbi:MAG: hypothetical protein KAS81_02710 [Anaerolineales bacterium]|nr:hypothetical protein [Anaerolineales bacterium]